MSTIKVMKDPKQIGGIKFNKEKMKECKLIEDSNQVKLYVNAFPIQFKKDFHIYEYPISIEPEVKDQKLKKKILTQLFHDLHECYGNFHQSGEHIYATRLISEAKEFQSKIIFKGENYYHLKVNKNPKQLTIKAGQKANFSQIDEKIIFMVLREILLTNPNVRFDKDNLYLEGKDNIKIVKGKNQKYYIHDGFKLSLKSTDNGLLLIIGIKNKIKGELSIYDILMDENINNYGEDQDERIEKLIGLRFIEDGFSKSKIISDIKFNATNATRNHGGKTYKIFEYYKEVLKKDITDKNQPLVCVEVKGDGDGKKFLYYASEYCKLSLINDEDIEDFNFMNNLSKYTKLNPDEKIKQIKKCLDLFKDKTKKIDSKKEDNEDKNKIIEKKDSEVYNSSDEKRKFYGIEITPFEKDIKSFYITQPKFNNIKKTNISINGLFEVGREKINTNKWICLYPKSIEKQTYTLLDKFLECSRGLGINIKNDDSNWIEMSSNNANDWIGTVEEQIDENELKFVIFFLSKQQNNLYNKLKEHSLCTKGYISQVIKLESLNKAMRSNRGPNSYISKILLQINCKLGGANYFLNLDKDILDRNIMIIALDFGLNSSHTWQKGQKGGMTMVATTDSKFSKFHVQNEIIKVDENYNLKIQEHINNFINASIAKYRKQNKDLVPKNIIFYRQGISSYQKDYIFSEVKIIEEICNNFNINYYYVIINTKTSFKFFEYNLKKSNKEKGDFKNPERGLVVLDQITDNSKFEFYLQPQKVTQGSATPTYFHAIYGNMNYPELLIKLTYWTTYIYPNWSNAIRVPHVMKIAEKYSYMTAKITRKRNMDKMSDTLTGI